MMQVTGRTNNRYPLRLGAAVIIAFVLSVFLISDGADAASSPKSQQQTFASPEEGVIALVDALNKNDVKALSAILGPLGMQLISSGDTEVTQEVRSAFLSTYKEKNRLEKVGDTKVILHAGNNDWPFPIPLVKKGQSWYFDSKAGKEEALNRRIGSNELDAVQVCLAYVDAQKEYVLRDHDRDGIFEYGNLSATRTRKTVFTGKHGKVKNQAPWDRPLQWHPKKAPRNCQKIIWHLTLPFPITDISTKS
jgi:hypothetical protein